MTKNIKTVIKQLLIILVLLLVSLNANSQNYSSRQTHWFINYYIPHFKFATCELIDGKLKFEISFNGGNIVFNKEGTDVEKFIQTISNKKLNREDKSIYVYSVVFSAFRNPPENSYFELGDSIYPLHNPDVERRVLLDQAIRCLLDIPDDVQPINKSLLYEHYAAMEYLNSEPVSNTKKEEKNNGIEYNETEYSDIEYDNYDNTETYEEDALELEDSPNEYALDDEQDKVPAEQRIASHFNNNNQVNSRTEKENKKDEGGNNILEIIVFVAFLYFLFSGGKKAKKELDKEAEEKERKKRQREEEENRRLEQEQYNREHYFFLEEKGEI